MTDLQVNIQIYIILMARVGVKRLHLYPINLHNNSTPQ